MQTFVKKKNEPLNIVTCDSQCSVLCLVVIHAQVNALATTFPAKKRTFIAVTSDLRCVLTFQMLETTLYNCHFYFWAPTLFAKLR